MRVELRDEDKHLWITVKNTKLEVIVDLEVGDIRIADGNSVLKIGLHDDTIQTDMLLLNDVPLQCIYGLYVDP